MSDVVEGRRTEASHRWAKEEHEPIRLRPNAKDWSGHVSGRLKVIAPHDQSSDGHIRWSCLCDCGKTTYVSSNKLLTTKSCGCVGRWFGYEKKPRQPKPIPAVVHDPLAITATTAAAAGFDVRRAIDIGTAGEHIVCADLILSGYRAFLASAGSPYDIVVDVAGQLVRVTVKSSLGASERPAREGSRVCYQFAVTRSRRRSDGKTDARKYESGDVDIVAFCALDRKVVAYCHILECAQSMHFDVPSDERDTPTFARNTGRYRKTFRRYSIGRALAVHSGAAAPLTVNGRGKYARD